MESSSTAHMGSRRRPLHTCGVSLIAIAHGAYIRAQRSGGPFCLLTEKIASIRLFTSLLHFVVQYDHCLFTILSFMDDQILALENSVEAIFPPSKHVFNKIDKLVEIAETLPAKLDLVVNKLPTIIHRAPYLHWPLACAIAWLNFWLSILSYQRWENSKEKEIVVDISCDHSVHEEKREMDSDGHVIPRAKEDIINPPSCVASESGGPNAEIEVIGSRVGEGTYKDALKKGKKGTYNAALGKERKEDMQENEKCHGGTNERSGHEEGYRKKLRNSDVIQAENGEVGRKESIEWTDQDGSTYKDALKKGIKEDKEKGEACNEGTEERQAKEEGYGKDKRTNCDVSRVEKGNKGRKKKVQEQGKMSSSSKKANAGGGDASAKEMEERIWHDDAILALFESAWIMKPGGGGKGSPMARCASYQW